MVEKPYLGGKKKGRGKKLRHAHGHSEIERSKWCCRVAITNGLWAILSIQQIIMQFVITAVIYHFFHTSIKYLKHFLGIFMGFRKQKECICFGKIFWMIGNELSFLGIQIFPYEITCHQFIYWKCINSAKEQFLEILDVFADCIKIIEMFFPKFQNLGVQVLPRIVPIFIPLRSSKVDQSGNGFDFK